MTKRAVKYYEEKGLICSKRNFANYRVYDEVAIERLQFIADCRANGMKLSCIEELLACRDDISKTPDNIQERIESIRTQAHEHIEQMHRILAFLDELGKKLTKEKKHSILFLVAKTHGFIRASFCVCRHIRAGDAGMPGTRENEGIGSVK